MLSYQRVARYAEKSGRNKSSITCILFVDCYPTRLLRALLLRYSNGIINLLKSCEDL